jgi:hypothetical protein
LIDLELIYRNQIITITFNVINIFINWQCAIDLFFALILKNKLRDFVIS